MTTELVFQGTFLNILPDSSTNKIFVSCLQRRKGIFAPQKVACPLFPMISGATPPWGFFLIKAYQRRLHYGLDRKVTAPAQTHQHQAAGHRFCRPRMP